MTNEPARPDPAAEPLTPERARSMDAAEFAAALRAATGLPAERVRHDGERLLLDPDTVLEFLPTLVLALAGLSLLAGTLLFFAAGAVPAAAALAIAALLFSARFTLFAAVSEYDLLDRRQGLWLRGRLRGTRASESVRFPFVRVAGLAVKVAARARGEEDPALTGAIRKAHDDGGHVHADANEIRPVTFESRYAVYARLDNGMDFLLLDLNLADFDKSRAAAACLAAWTGKPLLP